MTAILSNESDVTTEHYVVLGLANCFIKEDGDAHQVKVLEPIPSAALEAILKGIPTSYSMAYATTIGAVLPGDTPTTPDVFPSDIQICDDFASRAIAAARTYHVRPQAQTHIALNTTYEDFNTSLDRKRVLNSEHIVKTEDNVKQHAYTHQVL